MLVKKDRIVNSKFSTWAVFATFLTIVVGYSFAIISNLMVNQGRGYGVYNEKNQGN